MEEPSGSTIGYTEEALEVAYLRGALQAKEQECQQMMAHQLMQNSQQEAMMKTIAECSVKMATLCHAVTELLSSMDAEFTIKKGLLS